MAGGAAVKNPMNFDEAWPILLEEAINKITDILELEGQPNHQCFSPEEYMRLYTIVYNVCHPNQFGPEVKKLYDQYKKAFEDYISSKVLPSLRRKENENLLRELLRRWNNHKTMTYWLSRFFSYISRYYIPKMELPSLVETSHLIFYNLVHGEIKDQVSDIIISLIDREREGEQIDQAMVKEVLHIYEEIGGGDASKHYAKDIEEAIIEATSTFYSKKAFGWIAIDSCEDYMLKVEECLEQEKSRFSNYSSKYNVLEVVQHELLKVHTSKLEEKKPLHHEEMVISDLPQEILIDIFSRLPAKSIGKSRCLSKPLRNLLSSSQFIKSHLSRKTHQEHLIFIDSDHLIQSIATIKDDAISIKLELPDYWIEVVGSCDGLVLLVNELHEKFVVNPITMHQIKAPVSPLLRGRENMYGFGYDSSIDDYKIVTISYAHKEYEKETFVDVYCVKRGICRRVKNSPYDHTLREDHHGAFLNGAIHWLARSRESSYSSVIAAFSLVDEVFTEISAPRDVNMEKYEFDKLVVFADCLCIVGGQRSEILRDVWVMKEYGLAESWTNLGIYIDDSFDAEYAFLGLLKPLCFIGDEEILVAMDWKTLRVYNLKEGTLRDMTVNGVPAVLEDGVTFMPTLVSPASE